VTLLASLKNRVFLATALVAVVPIALAMRIVTARVTREAEAELWRGLGEAQALLEQNYAARLDTMTLVARLIADLPKLKAAVATDHPPTVRPLVLDYRARTRSDLFAVSNASGTLLAKVGPTALPSGQATAAPGAAAGSEATTFETTSAGVLHVVAVPITIGHEAPELLGTLSLGFALNRALAQELKTLTHSEIAFAAGDRILSSSLPEGLSGELASVWRPGASGSLWLGGAEYVVSARSVAPSDEGAPLALILRSRGEHLQSLQTFRAALVFTALASVLVAVLLSYGVAKTVTQPLADIAATMREIIATGDLARKIHLGRAWDDEDARLLAGTFNTLTDSIARFQREAALRERLSSLGRLSTVVAHEVRNPLMIIKTSLRSLRRQEGMPQDASEAIVDIDHEVSRLERIVRDVLDFARPVRVDWAPTDVNAVCRTAAGAAMTGDGAAGLELRLDPGLPAIVTDGELLRTALVNVVTNGREAALARRAAAPPAHHAPAGSAAPAPPAGVELRTWRTAEGRLAIAVRDQGLGIHGEDLPHIFDPYYTTKRTGTGLGLAIAKNIVESLGGAISAHSHPGEGTEIRIELPEAPAGRAEAQKPAALEEA
jgi:signal transduction histidine kinase